MIRIAIQMRRQIYRLFNPDASSFEGVAVNLPNNNNKAANQPPKQSPPPNILSLPSSDDTNPEDKPTEDGTKGEEGVYIPEDPNDEDLPSDQIEDQYKQLFHIERDWEKFVDYCLLGEPSADNSEPGILKSLELFDR